MSRRLASNRGNFCGVVLISPAEHLVFSTVSVSSSRRFLRCHFDKTLRGILGLRLVIKCLLWALEAFSAESLLSQLPRVVAGSV